MPAIRKLILQNFKKFPELTLDFDPGKNILIGDNEAGKSSVLLALDLVLRASRNRVEALNFESLFNNSAVSQFLSGEKRIDLLPKLIVDVFLEEGDDQILYGAQNILHQQTDGLRMIIEPQDGYGDAIKTVLSDDHPNFPYEYYSVQFWTFSGAPYASLRRPLNHIMLDSSRIDSEYAAREYTRSVYSFNAPVADRYKLENLYRKNKEAFTSDHLIDLNKELTEYKFDVRTSVRSNLESDLVITEDGIPLENRGKGRQCFIKTEFALGKHKQGILDVMLLEEPENHLSHTSMKRLVEKLADNEGSQLFIATHSSHICSRLDLRHALLIGTSSKAGRLKGLTDDTADFFMKAPDNNVLEFALSNRVMLVEGDAEFILLEAFYKEVTGGRLPHTDDVHVISIGGTSFKRYLELANLLGIRIAAIRDNDGDYEHNCIGNYSELISDHAKVFADPDNARSTFEIGLYQENKAICDKLFGSGRKTLTPLQYMLANKAETAFELLKNNNGQLTVPDYIQRAIEWIRE